jgi:chloramphenicol O-acetyltransferase type A
MKTEIDIENWNRKDHFRLYSKFSEPFCGICTNVDCTKAYFKAKENKMSFYLYYLYLSLKAANEIKEFRYRIEDGKVYCYDRIHAAPTVDREDGTFGFSILNYSEDVNEFMKSSKAENDKVRKETGLDLSYSGYDVIHYTVFPWAQITSISHPRDFGFEDSIPKVSFGKYFEENGMKKLPVAVHVNHALADGFHIGKYLELFQKLLES